MLENSNKAEKRKSINIVRNHYDDTEKVEQLINTVNQSGGIDYSKKKMNEYRNKSTGNHFQFC